MGRGASGPISSGGRPYAARRQAVAIGTAGLLAIFSLGVAIGRRFSLGENVSAVQVALRSSCAPWLPGRQQQQRRAGRVQRIAVLGERNSGTNLMEHLLLRNLDLSDGVRVTPNLTNHKHFMQPNKVDPCHEPLDATLVLVGVRNVFDWSHRMFELCYCCFGSKNSLVHSPYPFDVFITRPYEPTTQPLTQDKCHEDVDIHRSLIFSNLLVMRSVKYDHWLNLTSELGVRAVELVRWEDMLQPEQQVAWLRSLAARHGLRLAAEPRALEGDARSWVKRGGFRPAAAQSRSVLLNPGLLAAVAAGRPQGSVRLRRQDLELLNNLTDWRVEQRMGYEPLALPPARGSS